MAAPSWRSAGTFAGSTGDITPGLPTGWQQDDIFLMIVEVESNQSVSAPSGWANVTNSPANATTAPKIYVMWRRATASESAPTISDSGDHQLAIIHAFSGCKTTGNPWNVTSSSSESSADTSGTCPSVTTTVTDTMVVLCATAWSSASFSGWSNGNLTSLTERSDNGSSAGFGGAIGVATGVKASTGSTGTTSVTYSNSMQKAFITVALEPGGGVNAGAGTAATSVVANDATVQPGLVPAAGTTTGAVEAFDATAQSSFVIETGDIPATAYQPSLQTSTNPTAGHAAVTVTANDANIRGPAVVSHRSLVIEAEDRVIPAALDQPVEA